MVLCTLNGVIHGLVDDVPVKHTTLISLVSAYMDILDNTNAGDVNEVSNKAISKPK